MLHKACARCALILTVMVGVSSIVHAESPVTDPLYVPDSLSYYNPLQHSRPNNTSRHYDAGAEGLDNEQLATQAEYIRNNEMTAEQRALNHQWLEQEHYNDDIRFGGKVVSYLVRMGFRTYWDGLRNKHYSSSKLVPDSDGNGKISEDVEYKLRFSEDDVNLSVEYEF